MNKIRHEFREVVEYLLKMSNETDEDVIDFYTDVFMTLMEENQTIKP